MFRVQGFGFSVKKCRMGEEKAGDFRVSGFGPGGLDFRVEGVGQLYG